MKALKLLTQVKTYVPSIYRALAKYACNLYRKCTSRVLKQNSLLSGNFILINTCLSSAFYATGFDWASGFHRAQSMKSRSPVDENSSGRRKWLEEKVKKDSPDTGIPLETYTNALKIGAKANPFDYVFNTRYIPSFNHIRTLFYLRLSLHRMCTVPLPPLHQEKDGATTVQVWCSYEETYYKGKRRLKESANKVRTDGFAFFIIFVKNIFAKIGLAVRSVYRLFTNALRKWYRKGTEKLLESYQIGTNGSSLAVALKTTAGEEPNSNGRSVDQASVMRCICIDKAWIVRKTVPVYTLLTHYQRFIPASSILDLYSKGDSFQTSVFKHLKLLSWVKMCFCSNKRANRLKLFLNSILNSIHDSVSEGVGYVLRKFMGISFALRQVFQPLNISFNELKSIRTYSLLVLMFYMFSLSAQTPRKDSGADGLIQLMQNNELPKLIIGDSLPSEFWDQKLIFHYRDGSSQSIVLESLKDKLIVIDFWATYCSPCVKSLDKWNAWQADLADDVAIIPIHLYDFSSKALPFAEKRDWSLPMVFGNVIDTAINQLFYYNRSYGQVWIRNGKLFAIPVSWEVTLEDIHHAIQGIPPKMNLSLTHSERSKERGMQQ